MIVDDEQGRAFFADCERSAWRWETQPVYTMPREQESFSRFLAGEPEPEGHNSVWHEKVRAWTAAGKVIGRVRTVQRPYTDYQRYQLSWGIPGNVAAGEDIRILDLTDLDLDLPMQDFWLFDDSIVMHLNFRQDGTLINKERIEDPDLDYYVKLRDTALAHAVRFNDWNART